MGIELPLLWDFDLDYLNYMRLWSLSLYSILVDSTTCISITLLSIRSSLRGGLDHLKTKYQFCELLLYRLTLGYMQLIDPGEVIDT